MSKFIGFVTHEQVHNLTGKVERVVYDSHVKSTKKELKAWFSEMQATAHLCMEEINAQSFELYIEKY